MKGKIKSTKSHCAWWWASFLRVRADVFRKGLHLIKFLVSNIQQHPKNKLVRNDFDSINCFLEQLNVKVAITVVTLTWIPQSFFLSIKCCIQTSHFYLILRFPVILVFLSSYISRYCNHHSVKQVLKHAQMQVLKTYCRF